MIILGSSHIAGSGAVTILEDVFTGGTLDTDEWTAATLGGSSTVTQNNELILTGTTGAVSSARILSTTAIPTTGIVVLEVDWTPGKTYSGATGKPYIMIIPSGATREGTYEFPINYPSLFLGATSDTTTRTKIYCGIYNVGGHVALPNVTCNENTQYHLKWSINWDAETVSLWLDNTQIVTDQTVAYYTPSGDHFLELAYCDYGAASNPIEKFDNLIITTE